MVSNRVARAVFGLIDCESYRVASASNACFASRCFDEFSANLHFAFCILQFAFRRDSRLPSGERSYGRRTVDGVALIVEVTALLSGFCRLFKNEQEESVFGR